MSAPAEAKKPKGPLLILASASPRRKALLESAGLDAEVIPSQVAETHLPGETPHSFVRRIALAKAQEVAHQLRHTSDHRPLLAADTVVVIDDKILGKPGDRQEARALLQRLSGRTHQVITGFCLLAWQPPQLTTLHQEEVTTLVRFKELSQLELEDYLETHEWSDKAGAYAIQGHAAFIVRAIEGSYTNVVGLPLCEAVDALIRLGLHGRS